jgi:hypothetical protein
VSSTPDGAAGCASQWRATSGSKEPSHRLVTKTSLCGSAPPLRAYGGWRGDA